MSTYAELYIQGRKTLWFRNGVTPEVLYLFQRSELTTISGDEAMTIAQQAYAHPETLEHPFSLRVFQTSVASVRDRLNVSGTGVSSAEAAYEANRSVQIELSEAPWDSYVFDDPELSAMRQRDLETLRHDSHDAWIRRAAIYLCTALPLIHRESTDPLLAAWGEHAEDRLILRSFLEAADPAAMVTLLVEDLIEAGWLDEDIDPYWQAVEQLRQPLVPAIIVTEGPADVAALGKAMAVLKPHLVPYVRFLDFAAKPEGSADGAVRTVQSLVAAQVANPVILLLDNDPAGRRTCATVSNLPSHFRVRLLPNTELASSYPTIGPTGRAEDDVNGRAGSIEMYMGRDCLTAPDGLLRPVEWGARDKTIGEYQGAVSSKDAVQKAFAAKAQAALANPC